MNHRNGKVLLILVKVEKGLHFVYDAWKLRAVHRHLWLAILHKPGVIETFNFVFLIVIGSFLLFNH